MIVVGVDLGLGLVIVGDVATDGFEDEFETAGGSKGGREARDVELVRAQIVEDGAIIVEKRFNVDRFDRPDAVVEDASALFEPPMPLDLGATPPIEVGRPGLAEDGRRAGVGHRARLGDDSS